MVDRRDTSYTGPGDVTGFFSGSTAVNLGQNATWCGSHGSAAYTVGDIVTALKNRGILDEDAT